MTRSHVVIREAVPRQNALNLDAVEPAAGQKCAVRAADANPQTGVGAGIAERTCHARARRWSGSPKTAAGHGISPALFAVGSPEGHRCPLTFSEKTRKYR